MGFSITQLYPHQDRLKEVFTLYRKHSSVLGFLPKGAFEEASARGNLIIAMDQSDQIVGYILIRIGQRMASLTHLCVATEFQQRGIATLLLEELKCLTRNLDGIKLRCRRDFEASRLWPKIGFTAKGEKTGRGADSAPLVVWHLDHNPADLLSSLPSSKIKVAIDANVFFDLFWPDRPKGEITKALCAPWIDDIVELGLTSEIFNDIERGKDDALRASSKEKARSYLEIRASIGEVDRLAAEIRELYPSTQNINARDNSDIRHLAITIAAKVGYFVTRDEGILAKAPEVLQNYDVYVLSPAEFITRIDNIERDQEYQPLRLGGSNLLSKRLDHAELEEFLQTFRCTSKEKSEHFKQRVERCLSVPQECSLQVAYNGEGGMAATMALQRISGDEIRFRILRLTGQTLSKTILRHLVMKAIVEANQTNARILRVEDPNLPRDSISALEELGFSSTSDGWVKLLLGGFHTREAALELLSQQNIFPAQSVLAHIDSVSTLVWPGKISAGEITCCLVPIRAEWAEHFFDVDLASQRLPGISDIRLDLHLGVEGVYYSASNIKLQPPGHILWYVSLGNEKNGSMAVKATSRLREVVRGTAKELFSRFRRLGVYAWKDLMGTAKGNPNKILTAFRFSHTELFPRPLDSAAMELLGVHGPFPGPRPLSFDLFQQIYHYAFPSKS